MDSTLRTAIKMTKHDASECRMPLSADVLEERLDAFRELFPEVFAEGKVDLKALAVSLGQHVDDGRERYGLSWAGKAEAMRAIQVPSVGTLIPVPEVSVNFETSENVFIEGDNLEVLKLLQKSYYGRVKLIYIDPPYNTGNEFIYPDNFREGLQDYLKYSGQVDAEGMKVSTNTEANGRFHSKWLSMIWPRLFVARNLLSDDGSIWISIDDNEVSNLRAVCNEIFGEENYVATFIWQKRTTRENRKVFSVNHDYIVCYARSKEQFQATRNMLPLTEDVLSRYENPDKDPRGEWQSVSLNAQAGHATKAQFYTVKTPSGRIVGPPAGRCWVVTRDKMDELVADGRVWFGPNGDNVPRRKVFLSEAKVGLTPHTLWSAEEVGTNDSAKKNLIKLFDGIEAYDTPKPVELVQRIVQIGTGKEPGELVLDFFAGAGTTGEAVLRANEADTGHRAFILVQLPEPVGEEKQGALSGCKTIAEVCRERITRTIASLEKERRAKFDAMSGKDVLGVRVFNLSSSNFKIWDGDAMPKDPERLAEQIRLFADNVVSGRSQEAILSELILKSGLPLTARIETTTVGGATVYSIADGMLLICLEDPLKKEVLRGMVDLKPQRVLCLDHAFRGNDKDKVNVLLEMRSHGVEFRTV